MNIIKRNGKETTYNGEKIMIAVRKANNEVPENERLSELQIMVIEEQVRKELESREFTANIEDIQNLVINAIQRQQAYSVATIYTEYRYKRELARRKNTIDDEIMSLIACQNEEIMQENSNKNPIIESTQRDYIAGTVSKDITMRTLLPSDVKKEHEEGSAHFHDADYFLQTIHNCCLVNIEDMLQNNTVISNVLISKPKGILVACNVTTQIIAQVASNQHGGQTFSLAHLAPFVDVSRQRIIQDILNEDKETGVVRDIEQVKIAAEMRVKKEIKAAIKIIQYQLVTLMTTNGQTPFVSMFMYLNEAPEGRTRDDLALLIEEVLRQRIKGLPNEKGEWVTAAFPKLLYVMDENNAYEGSKYYYLTKMSAECIAGNMVPDIISEKIMLKLKGDVYPCMGCRSFLTPDRFTDTNIGNIAKAKNYNPDKHKYYGRFNQGVYTINLVDIACASGRDMDKFWKIFDEKMQIAHKALRCRHERLLGTKSDVAPILWQHGALARLNKGETIDELLYNGYSTISLGYAGLYECCMYMTGKSHTDDQAKPFAKQVMLKLNEYCNEWKAKENIDYSIYGTPIESTTYKFAKALRRKYGVIKDVTDHNYITNSYHVNVREKIDAFTKLKFEAEFQELSPGGAISYVEIPNMKNNIDGIIKIMQYIYETIMYAELNTKSDFCHECGYNGEIKIIEDENKKLIWECPNCKNRDQNKMNVARRTCGYIGTQFWNQGRTQEIKDRELHVGIASVNVETE